MREHHFILAGALALASTAALAEPYAGGAVVETATAKGTILTDAKGMTLYTFDNDGDGSSACYDACTKKWPPLAAAKTDKADGTMQWSHDGKPLYHWQMDKKPGDVTGDGVGGIWHVAKE